MKLSEYKKRRKWIKKKVVEIYKKNKKLGIERTEEESWQIAEIEYLQGVAHARETYKKFRIKK